MSPLLRGSQQYLDGLTSVAVLLELPALKLLLLLCGGGLQLLWLGHRILVPCLQNPSTPSPYRSSGPLRLVPPPKWFPQVHAPFTTPVSTPNKLAFPNRNPCLCPSPGNWHAGGPRCVRGNAATTALMWSEQYSTTTVIPTLLYPESRSSSLQACAEAERDGGIVLVPLQPPPSLCHKELKPSFLHQQEEANGGVTAPLHPLRIYP